MNKDNKFILGCIHAIMSVSLVVVSGFTSMFLWNNIIAELFNLRTFGFIQAIAIDLAFSYFVYQYKADERTFIEKYVSSLITTLNFLVLGFILTFFI